VTANVFVIILIISCQKYFLNKIKVIKKEMKEDFFFFFGIIVLIVSIKKHF